MTNKIICPECKSKEVIKWGKRNTENRGKIQRYKCKSCSETFVNDAFFKMRNSPEKITCALDLFHRGLSTREVQEHFKAFHPHNSSWVSIYKWVKKYSLKIANFTDSLKVQTGSYIEVDEMEYHRRKSHKRKLGIDKNWFIDSIDVKTRFMISSAFVKNRSKINIKKVLTKIKDKSGQQVKVITTDGLQLYADCIKKVFGYYNLKKGLVNHNVVNASQGEGFNIWVERMHNSIRQRTHGFRGLHGSVESAYALMKGQEIFYNFVKKHEALKGKTPSELAIPSLQFETPNRWLELIQIANRN
ncbi:MAG: DDE-type integrase/transposase/recombinase [Candidatus Pacearchaeota archaeon]|nr:DDE-type integrase/transposase/recombinase [Candidatus Pacearchaeota archaeon]